MLNVMGGCGTMQRVDQAGGGQVVAVDKHDGGKHGGGTKDYFPIKVNSENGEAVVQGEQEPWELEQIGDEEGKHPGEREDATALEKYDYLLKKIVDGRTGFVKYEVAAREQQLVLELVEGLKEKQKFKSRSERLSYHLNAYNLLVVYNVLIHGKRVSPKSIRGFYAVDRFTVNGQSMTLNELFKQEILSHQDPRVHFAAVHGFKGGAALSFHAYQAQHLEKQLEMSARRFVNDRRKNSQVAGTALLSSVFKQHEHAFKTQRWKNYNAFIKQHLEPQSPLYQVFKSNNAPEIVWLEMDIGLNQFE